MTSKKSAAPPRPSLQAAGVTAMFEPGVANFSRMCSSTSLVVTDVVHRVGRVMTDVVHKVGVHRDSHAAQGG